MVAHIQEPGANDDGSGCGTLYALAIALQQGDRREEAGGAGTHADVHLGRREPRQPRLAGVAIPSSAKGVQYMFSLDMTGEDTAKTGGTFLIEKQADPSAVWARPSDPHTAWGASEVKASELKGSLLNDVHLAICRRRAKDTGWIVKTNPYEGGSDHTEFKNAGIPALLDWHFTDRFYHTNLDRPDKASAGGDGERRRRGRDRARGSWRRLQRRMRWRRCDLIANAASARLALEQTQAATPEILAAWRKWYGEALDSVRRLPITGAAPAVDAAAAAARARIGG